MVNKFFFEGLINFFNIAYLQTALEHKDFIKDVSNFDHHF